MLRPRRSPRNAPRLPSTTLVRSVVLLITTKAPSFTTSGSMSASYGSYQTFRTNSYITGGVTETLAASFAVSFARQGKGWGVSQADGADTAKIRHDLNMRGKLLFEPSDSSRVTILGDYSDREANRSEEHQYELMSLIRIPYAVL